MTDNLRPRIVTREPPPRKAVWPWALVGALVGALGVMAIRGDLAPPNQEDLGLTLKQAQDENQQLLRRLAQLERGQQVTDAANSDLRKQLIEAEGLQSELREEIAFYRRLLDVGGEIRGLAIHDLTLTTTASPRVVTYRLVLSQNLNKASVIDGSYRIEVEGVRDDRAEVLDSVALGLDPDSLQFSFKYYQLLRGSLSLPAGFEPLKINVEVQRSDRSSPVLRSYDWRPAAP